jgi:hypothetical protein
MTRRAGELAAKVSAVCWPFQWPLRPWSGKLEVANTSAEIANIKARVAFKGRSSGRHPIRKQHAIEVVALVLNDPRFKPLHLLVDPLSTS